MGEICRELGLDGKKVKEHEQKDDVSVIEPNDEEEEKKEEQREKELEQYRETSGF